MAVEPTESISYLANWSARLFARAIEARLRPLGLAPGQLPLFFALAAHGPMSQKALVQIVGIEQPTMAATLARMERDGLVDRQPDPNDRRSASYALTPKATRHAEAVDLAVRDINAIALDGIAEADREAVVRVLNSAVKSLKGWLTRSAEPG